MSKNPQSNERFQISRTIPPFQKLASGPRGKAGREKNPAHERDRAQKKLARRAGRRKPGNRRAMTGKLYEFLAKMSRTGMLRRGQWM
jgi:hypothetical protein